MSKRNVGFAYDNFMLLHENHKRPHPERPERIMSIYTYLLNHTTLLDRCVKVRCPFADLDHIRAVHSQAMIDQVERSRYNKHKLRDEGVKVLKQHGVETNYLEYDVFINRWTYECALMAAGAVIEACNAIVKRRECEAVFAAVRPPGHHAEETKVQGFCVFNSIAVAAKYLQKECGVKKVCIFDWDIHCGDGTSEIFYEDNSVLYVSIHRYDDG
jgi:acetoin utilization deacetylase AcuC-like enzyme